MSKISTPRDLLVEELKDLYSAEMQLVRALPKMAKAASSGELKQAFLAHLEETKEHAGRLEQVANDLGGTPRGKKCKAMEGLVEESRDVMDEDADPGIMDLALIGAAQKVEHYEIAGYGTARTLANLAGEKRTAEVLQRTLDEEGQADKRLTAIAENLSLATSTQGH